MNMPTALFSIMHLYLWICVKVYYGHTLYIMPGICHNFIIDHFQKPPYVCDHFDYLHKLVSHLDVTYLKYYIFFSIRKKNLASQHKKNGRECYNFTVTKFDFLSHNRDYQFFPTKLKPQQIKATIVCACRSNHPAIYPRYPQLNY